MDYFGKLKGYRLSSMVIVEREQLFVTEGLFQPTFSISLSSGINRIFPPPEPPTPKPTKELREALHSYLLKSFKKDIEAPYYSFFVDFNDQVLGLNRDREREVALQHYKILTDQVMTKVIRVFWTTKSDGIERVTNIPKFEMLMGQREALKANLVNSPLLIPYLEGNEPYFNNPPEGVKELLMGFIEFEIALRIVDNLNRTYLFEPKSQQNGPNSNNSVQSEIEHQESTIDHQNRPSSSNTQNPRPKAEKSKNKMTNEMARSYLIKHVFSKKQQE